MGKIWTNKGKPYSPPFEIVTAHLSELSKKGACTSFLVFTLWEQPSTVLGAEGRPLEVTIGGPNPVILLWKDEATRVMCPKSSLEPR